MLTSEQVLATPWARLGPHIRRVLIGLFLIAAFAATGLVLLFVLTAQQLQSSMSAPDLASLNVTIGTIRHDISTLDYYYTQVALNTATLKQGNLAITDANEQMQGALAQMTSNAGDITAFINQNDVAYIHAPLKLHPFTPGGTAAAAPAPDGSPGPAQVPAGSNPATAPGAPGGAQAQSDFTQSPILDFDSDVAGYFAAYYAALEAAGSGPDAEAARSGLNAFKAKVYQQLSIYTVAHQTFDKENAVFQSWTAKVASLEKQNGGLWKELTKGEPLDDSTPYYNLCEDFYSFKLLVGDFAYKVVLLPKMMLVLTLAIFMGILGSLIYISQDFLNHPDERTFWNILFRIGLGAGVAFALFFFAAAGMLAMTQGTAAGTKADMSPYLISFLGITGGYLSDRVTQWMREVGENTFKVAPGGPPPRWAVGLDAALKAAGLSGAQLASATGATAGDADAWIALTKPVPGAEQALVAAFLREHPSHIFTDIAPG